MEIYRNTKSDDGAPEAENKPFENALYRLQSYFGSSSDVMLLRRKLALMVQKPDETDLAFISRVGSTAKLCNFNEEKEFEEIASTIAEHSRTKEVRIAALKMINRKGRFTDLVDKVREIETIRMNEQFFMQKYNVTDRSVIASVSADYPSKSFIREYPYHRSVTRGNFNYRRGNTRGTRYRRPESDQSRRNDAGRSDSSDNKCWRCNSPYHLPFECNSIDKICRNCGRAGHTQRACHERAPAVHTLKRSAEDNELQANQMKRIASVEKTENNPDIKESVSVSIDE